MNPFGPRDPSRAAVIDAASGSVLSWGELAAAGVRVVGGPDRERGLILLLAQNDLSSIATYAGAVEAGTPIAIVDSRTAPDAIIELVRAYRPRAVVGSDGTADLLDEECLLAAVESHPLGGQVAVPAIDPGPRPHPDLAVLLATSGTTGSRKFVRLSRRNLQSNAEAIGEYLGLTEDERPITTLPFHYSFGLSVVNSHWAIGAPIILTGESVMQSSLWASVRSLGATSLAGVPYTFQMLERVGFRDQDLPSIQTLQQAGGALDEKLVRVYAEHMAERGGRLFVMYGQTEATARIAYVPPDRLQDKLGSAGRVIPRGSLEIDPSEPGSSDGEVVYRGPNVMMGYAEGADDLETGDVLGGVLRTGDLGRLDDEGFLYLTGRSKRIVKVHGMRINLDEVESLLREHGSAAAVGEPDLITAFCEFGDEVVLAGLRPKVARRLRVHHYALRLQHVSAIPVTSSGKPDYGILATWT
jgi:acyl-CoA synthetase (AMP-forming)/AMP-acid ligase II